MTTFALIGSGWRARMFLDVARGLGTVRCVGAVVRAPRTLEVPTFSSLATCLAAVRPDFVLTTTPWAVTPAVVTEAVGRDVPVLAETPPAPDLDGLRSLWSAVGDSGRVQVAEQYPLMPAHAARAAVVASGVIGTPTQVQVSSTNQYHAISLVRGFLGAGRGPVTARATRTTAPLVSPLGRGGWTDDAREHPAVTTLATVDLGPGRSGVYDLTEQQTRNQLRFRRLLVRLRRRAAGRRGRADDRPADARAHAAGPPPERPRPRPGRLRLRAHHLRLRGRAPQPLPGAALEGRGDRHGHLLERTAAWVRGDGPPPYPLADGLHDHQVALAVEESAERDRPVATTREGWWDDREGGWRHVRPLLASLLLDVTPR